MEEKILDKCKKLFEKEFKYLPYKDLEENKIYHSVKENHFLQGVDEFDL